MKDEHGNKGEEILNERGGDAADYDTEAIVTTKRKDTGEIVSQSLVTNGIIVGAGYKMENGKPIIEAENGLVVTVFLKVNPTTTIQIMLKTIEIASRIATECSDGVFEVMKQVLDRESTLVSKVKSILSKHKQADRDIFKDNNG